MLKRVTIVANTLDAETWEAFDVPHIGEFLASQFDTFPETARIYCGNVSAMTDITPNDEASIAKLETYDDVFVMVFPAEPLTILYAVVAVLVVAVTVLATQGIPPTPTMRNTQAASANNELSERKNQPRPNGRIPDIYGTVRSTPDLISVPYTVFDDNKEIEYSFMCVGRGSYTVPRESVRDDVTRAVDVPGMSVAVYGPYNSPNSGMPQVVIGDPIGTRILNPARSNSINGQELRAPNAQVIVGNGNIRFRSPAQIAANDNSKIDFAGQFDIGEFIDITGAIEYVSSATYTRDIAGAADGFSFFSTVSPIAELISAGKRVQLVGAVFTKTGAGGVITASHSVSGTYTVLSVTTSPDASGSGYRAKVTLVNPAAENPQWIGVDETMTTKCNLVVSDGAEKFNLNGRYQIKDLVAKRIELVDPHLVNPAWATIGTTSFMSPIISVTADRWIGPFNMPGSKVDSVYCNFVAPNGAYQDDGKIQSALSVVVETEITEINNAGIPIGAPETFTTTIVGSSANRDIRGATAKIMPTIAGRRYRVRARRITPADYEFEGQSVDQIKWRDAYSMTNELSAHFGNVTTVQTRTLATSGALAIKERKLNMLATRNVPALVNGAFTSELYPSNLASDIFCAMALDARIGNRSLAELNITSIYNAVNESYVNFGNIKATEFNYTFDSTNISFEETARMIADAVFCTAYRRGNVLHFNFEKPTENSTLLFNHSNKIPNSETRTTRFGNQDNYDGVSYSYVDPNDDAFVTFYLPADRTAINPKEIESVGIRSRLQAYFLAWREWNKIRFSNSMVEFTGTQEATLLVNRDRILVADGTRSGSQDGEIVAQVGLTLTLSRDVVLPNQPVIFVQHSDGSTEQIPVSGQPTPNSVVLARVPRRPLVTDIDMYARTTFILVGNSNSGQNAYLVSECRPTDNMTSVVTAFNYDKRYYQNDSDFINNIVDDNGNSL